MKDIPKPIIVKKSLKHLFTPDEIAGLNIDFGNAYDALGVVEAEFEQVKSSYKAKIAEATSRMVTIRATINAGFEFRETEVEVVFRPAEKKKDFYPVLPEGDPMVQPWLKGMKPLLTEDMTPSDFQQDLLQAESVFSLKQELVLWNAGSDQGLLVVGRLGTRWYSALRANVGEKKLEERLDSEQKSYKDRYAAVGQAAKRATEWLGATVGKDLSLGFLETIQKVVDAQKDKVE